MTTHRNPRVTEVLFRQTHKVRNNPSDREPRPTQILIIIIITIKRVVHHSVGLMQNAGTSFSPQTNETTNMPSIVRSLPLLSALPLLANSLAFPVAAAEAPLERRYGALTYVGCFSSPGPLTNSGNFQYQSSGHCQQVCVGGSNQAVLGLTNGNDCYCGMEVPATSDKVDDSSCDDECTGYGQDDCEHTLQNRSHLEY